VKPIWLSTALVTGALTLAACGDAGRPVCNERDLEVGFEDSDADGFGTGEPVQYCPGFGEGLALNRLDCDDTNPAIFPGAKETCNGIDDDCDGERDQGFDNRVYYPDLDEDGFGARFEAEYACIRPQGFVRNAEDCDDTDPNVNPDAIEICNDGIDDDCDGDADDFDPGLDPNSLVTYYLDEDRDGYGTPFESFERCAPQSNWTDNADDCNDRDRRINPGADEICNNIDDDCDTFVDDDDPNILEASQDTFYRDGDGDGYGDASRPVLACVAVPGFSTPRSTDCDDLNAMINPGAVDICNGGIDDDCDPSTDEDTVSGDAYYIDTDGDGYGETQTEVRSCSVVPDRVLLPDDCDETDTDINPGADDVCEDGIDQDCSGADARCREGFEISASARGAGGDNQMRGVVLEATSRELVIDFALRASLVEPCTFDYYLWSRADEASPWQVEGTNQVEHQPALNQFLRSGFFDVEVVPGVEYAYGVAWSECTSNVLFNVGFDTNLDGPFALGEYRGWVRDLSYSGFSAGFTPPEFIDGVDAVPHMELFRSTSFVP